MKLELDKYNIYPTYRPGQKEQIQQLIDIYEKIHSGEITSKVAESSSPTGSGKTIINRAVGLALLDNFPEIKNVVYTTPLKALVYQIEQDEQLGIPTVLGKSNYDCLVFEGLDASDCPYRSKEMAKKKPTKCRRCPYMLAKTAFKDAKIGACTLDFYIYNRTEADVLIIDESASLENKLLGHFGIALPDHIQLDNLVNSIHDWMISLGDEAESYNEALEHVNLNSGSKNLMREIQQITRKLTTVERQAAKCGRILQIAKDENAYFIDAKRNFKLIRGEYPFNLMASKVKFIIMSSGTPTTSLICHNFSRVTAPHPIPVERRLIYYDPVGKMSRPKKNVPEKDRNDKDITIPKMAKKIVEIHNTYPRQTIVHCHSYEIASKLKEVMRHPAVLCQEPGLREEALRCFMKSTECIFLSVNYNEGINLEGDRFQINIIAKVPYPNLGDEWVVKRNSSDKEKMKIDLWYRMATAVAIEQAAGRTTRGLKDFSKSWILDENFGFFYSQNKNLLEPYFREALVWVE